MADKYFCWSVGQLKQELIRRGAVTRGRKVDLVERLKSYDRNFNFQTQPIELPNQEETKWPTVGYHQLVQDHRIVLPKLTSCQIEEYFLYRIAGDKNASADIKALRKGKDLLDSDRILACSVLIEGDSIYFSGIVGAAMKNKVSYNYKIKLEKISGDPVNTHCECPAGKGPHGTCKHVAAVLLMIECFLDCGVMKVQKSCTENLQNFHKPKALYEGKPVATESIPTKRKFSDDILQDPRPHKYRDNHGYTDFVRSMMINYCASSSQDIAMRYLHSSADIQTATQDHDYFHLPFTEYLVDNALQVTEDTAADIQKSTKLQSKSGRWFLERQWRLTASRFGDITHATSRRNMTKLCESINCSKLLHSKSIEHGKKYESKALKKFQETAQLSVEKCGLYVNANFPYLGASPDGIIGTDTIVEVKCPYAGRNSKIVPGKLFPFLIGDSENKIYLNCNSKYYDQVQGQLLISNKKYCCFVVYTFVDIFIQKIEFDEEYARWSLLPKLQLFYTKYYRPYIASNL